MIAIIDNGECYSDHTIYFVDVGSREPWRVAEALASDLGTLEALVETVEWFAQKPPTLAEFFCDHWTEPSALLVTLAELTLCEASGDKKPQPDKYPCSRTRCDQCGQEVGWRFTRTGGGPGSEMERHAHWTGPI